MHPLGAPREMSKSYDAVLINVAFNTLIPITVCNCTLFILKT